MSSPRRTRLDIIKNLPPLNLQQTKRKIMDLLARRDHSKKELTTKLKRRTDPETLEQALIWAADQNWLPSEEKIQEQVIRSLELKNKGQIAINLKLKQMGLKPTKLDSDVELKIAINALKFKFESDLFNDLQYKEILKQRGKVLRFLAGKGFTSETCQKALKAYFKK